MTRLLKSLSTSASTISSSWLFNVLNWYNLFLGISLISSLSPFVTISKICLSDVKFFQFLANSLVFPHIYLLVLVSAVLLMVDFPLLALLVVAAILSFSWLFLVVPMLSILLGFGESLHVFWVVKPIIS